MKTPVRSSILDYPRKTLTEKLWTYADGPDELPTLDANLRQLILSQAEKNLSYFGAKLLRCFLYGGSASYQWSEGADVDVSLYTDWSSIQAPFDEVEKFFKKVEIPYNGHPVHLFVKPPDQVEQFEVADAYYDVVADEWVLPPLVLPKDFDPDIYFKPFIKSAEKKAKKFDLQIGELSRAWHIWQKASEALPEARDPEVVRESIQKQTDEILKIAKDLSDAFIAVRERRYAMHDKLRDQMKDGKEAGRYERFQEPEIIWKYLDRAGYNEFIWKIAKKLESGDLEKILLAPLESTIHG